jgi:hypothetical protein
MSIHAFIQKQPRFIIIACLFIIGLVVARIAILPVSPPGFYIDEAATGAHVVSMLEQGTNANHEAWPLFSSSLGGGYTTPIYLYPLVAWSAVFGPHEISLRYFSEFMTLLGITFLALAVRYWLGKRIALVTAIAGLALPWSWLQGSLAWDPIMVPLLVGLSFFAFSALLFSTSRKLKIAATILLPVLLIALAYVYPPARATAPLLYLLFYIVLYLKRAMNLKVIALSALGAFILVIPLALFMIQPEALERTSTLSIFSHNSFLGAIGTLALNFSLLLNPVFLFIVGDLNLRHSTLLQGMLGIGALIPVIVLTVHAIRHRQVRFSPSKNKVHLFVVIAVLGILFGILGSALTSEGQPHSLRATAAWPFMLLLITLGWYLIFETRRKILTYTAIFVLSVTTLVYAVDLAVFYPARAADSFDVQNRQKIQNGEQTDYPPIVIDYYKNI